MRRVLVIVAAVLVLPLVTNRALAQAWVQPKGGYFFKLASGYLETDEVYNFRGDLEHISERDFGVTNWFRDVTLEAYLEYGLWERLTLVGKLPFKILTTVRIESLAGFEGARFEITNGGLSDLMLWLRTPLIRKRIAISFQPGVKIPLGYEREPDNLGPPLGTSYVDAEANLYAGISLYPLPGYISGGAGYRHRGGPFADEIPFSVEGGVTIGRLFAKLRFEGLKSTVEPEDFLGQEIILPLPGGGGATPESPLVGNRDEFKVMPTAAFSFSDRFALMAEVYAVVAGKNTVAGTTYVIGMVFTR